MRRETSNRGRKLDLAVVVPNLHGGNAAGELSVLPVKGNGVFGSDCGVVAVLRGKGNGHFHAASFIRRVKQMEL